MTHGAPDNYQVKPKIITYKLDDMAELAIRLGSLISIDRLGEVIYQDDFSQGLGKGIQTYGGTGSGATLFDEMFRSGGFSLKLTGGSDGILSANHIIYTPVFTESILGLETWFGFNVDVDYILIDLRVYTGIYEYRFNIKINVAEKQLLVLNDIEEYNIVITDFLPKNIGDAFLPVKMVCDYPDLKYKRIVTHKGSYDVSDVGCLVNDSIGLPGIEITFTVYSVFGENGIAYLDSIILTQNEP
jgi:hypothetical protein